MRGTTHIVTGLTAGAVAWVYLDRDPTHLIGGAVACVLTSAGPGCPDGDQSWLRWLPGGHRGLSHWWVLPVVVAGWLAGVGGPWWAWYAVLGWTMHLVGDFVFGEGDRPGIPLAPWWAHFGLGTLTPGDLMPSGGLVERRLAVWMIPAAGVWLLASDPVGPFRR